MPTRFPHGGEDAPLLAGDSRGRGGNAKKSSDGGVDKLMSRGVTVLAALLLLGLCAMLGVHLMGSNHSADSDLSNKDRSWIETLDDGTKILHGADGKLSVVTGDSVTKSPKHHKKKGSGDILDLLHDQNAKGSIDGEIDPTKDIASQQNDILLNKEKEMMDSLTAMANGGKDGSKKGKDPSVNPAEEAQKMMAGDAKSTTSTFDPRAAYKRHQEALSHLSKKDKHANENLKLTDKEKSELEQLESLTRKPPPAPPAYVTPEEQLLHKAAMKAKKQDEKGAEDWYNQLDDSVDTFAVRNQALIDLEEAGHKKDAKKDGAKKAAKKLTPAEHAAKATAEAVAAAEPAAEPVVKAESESEPAAAIGPEPVKPEAVKPEAVKPEPVAAEEKEDEVAETGEDEEEVEPEVKLAEPEPEADPTADPIEPFGAHDAEKKDDDEDEPAADPIEPFGADEDDKKDEDEDEPAADPIEPFGADDEDEKSDIPDPAPAALPVEAEVEADDEDEPAEPAEPLEPFGADEEAAAVDSGDGDGEEEPAEPVDPIEPFGADEEKVTGSNPGEDKFDEPEPVTAAVPATPTPTAPAADAGTEKHPTPAQIQWWKDHHPNGAALGRDERRRHRKPARKLGHSRSSAKLGAAPNPGQATASGGNKWQGIDLAQHLSCSDSLRDPATGRNFDVAAEFYASDETTLGPNGEAVKLGARAKAVRDTTFVSAFLRVDGPGAVDPVTYLTGVRHAACNAGRARLNAAFFADSPEMCAHVRRLYDNGRALSNQLAPPVPRLGGGTFRCTVKAVKDLALKPAMGLRPEAVVGGCANSARSFVWYNKVNFMVDASTVRDAEKNAVENTSQYAWFDGDVAGPGTLKALLAHPLDPAALLAGAKDEKVHFTCHSKAVREAQAVEPCRATSTMVVPRVFSGTPQALRGFKRRWDAYMHRYVPLSTHTATELGQWRMARGFFADYKNPPNLASPGSGLKPVEAAIAVNTKSGGWTCPCPSEEYVMNRLLNDEMFPEEKHFSGGKIAPMLTQEEKAKEDEAAVKAAAVLTAKGGDAVASMGGPLRPAASAGAGPSSFALRRGLGLLEDELNAAALGTEPIESDSPGKQFMDASPDRTDSSCARSEGGVPSGFAELPSMGLISWRFN